MHQPVPQRNGSDQRIQVHTELYYFELYAIRQLLHRGVCRAVLSQKWCYSIDNWSRPQLLRLVHRRLETDLAHFFGHHFHDSDPVTNPIVFHPGLWRLSGHKHYLHVLRSHHWIWSRLRADGSGQNKHHNCGRAGSIMDATSCDRLFLCGRHIFSDSDLLL